MVYWVYTIPHEITCSQDCYANRHAVLSLETANPIDNLIVIVIVIRSKTGRKASGEDQRTSTKPSCRRRMVRYDLGWSTTMGSFHLVMSAGTTATRLTLGQSKSAETGVFLGSELVGARPATLEMEVTCDAVKYCLRRWASRAFPRISYRGLGRLFLLFLLGVLERFPIPGLRVLTVHLPRKPRGSEARMRG